MAGTDVAERLRAQVVFAYEVAKKPSEWGPKPPPSVIGHSRRIIDGEPIDKAKKQNAFESFAEDLYSLTRVEAENAGKLKVLLGAVVSLRAMADDGLDEAATLAERLEDWTRQHYRFNDEIPSERSEIRKIAQFLARRYDVIPREVRERYSEKGFDFVEIDDGPEEDV